VLKLAFMIRGFWLFSAGLALAGCAMPAYVKTAYYGDLATLKKEIHAAATSRTLDRAKVLSLAKAVARREVWSARGDDALDRIRAARSCLSAVEPELRERSESPDDAGAESLLALVEANRVSRGPLVLRYAQSSSGAFRAVAARVTASPEHAALRRSFYVDPDERVRRAALRAAFEAADPADLDALLEAARLDPDGRSRSAATRAVGGIGAAGTALGLKDLWASADATVRLSIVEAWGMPRVFAAGGSTELLLLAESANSLASVAAAGELTRIGRDGAREGRAVLGRIVAQGTTDERLVAIQLVSLSDPDTIPALEKAAKSDDLTVRVVALARLLENSGRRAAVTAALEILAKGRDGAARQARVALAMAGDAQIAPLLASGLEGDEASFREQAAIGLFRLGKVSEMASALADSDPAVRMSVACSVLASAGRSG
jgi:HEAT repeat protein